MLGAGGITGFAYHVGVLSALHRLTGWDPGVAEVIVGTSAGSVCGSILRGGVPVDEVLAHALAAPSEPETMAQLRVLSGRDRSSGGWWLGPSSPALATRELLRGMRLRPGRLGTALLPSGRIPTEFLGDRLRDLHGLRWPEARFWACSVRLDDGQRVVFGEGDLTVDVGTAVEASSAIPGFFRPVTIGGKRYVDGAVHSPTNADLLAGADLDLVVIVSPMSASCADAVRAVDGPARIRSAQLLASEVGRLRRDGRAVLVIQPSRDETRAMGPFYMDPTRLVPTVAQATASTLRRLADPRFATQLDLLRRASAPAARDAAVGPEPGPGVRPSATPGSGDERA